MCGIIAVLRRRSRRSPPGREVVLEHLAAAQSATAEPSDLIARLQAAAAGLEAANKLLMGVPGVTCLLRDGDLATTIERDLAKIDEWIQGLEQQADDGGLDLPLDRLEEFNAALVRLKDATWALGKDRLRTAKTVADLGGRSLTESAIAAYTSISIALSALDRLEVRGRDSAGIHILVEGHGLDLASDELSSQLRGRLGDALFTSGAVRTPAGHLCFVYKTAAEIGELGDNSRVLRDAIRADRLLRRAVAAETAEATILCHTRWASVGIISQANAHPVNQEESNRSGPYVAAVLNGDVDNFDELRKRERLEVPPEITTDAKIIPALMSRRLADGIAPEQAFCQTVASFAGSVAIGCHAADHPDTLLMALRGSGQGLYIGLAEDAFVVASEPYGVVEETPLYLRMDGESTGGEAVALRRALAGELAGIQRLGYDGSERPVRQNELTRAEITTRDIDRGNSPHFLLKEISEAPRSFHKTLRGKIHEDGGRLSVQLGHEALPESLCETLRTGRIGRIIVIGQGTAAVAGQGVAAALQEALSQTRVRVLAMPATELSGFHLSDDMTDTLVVAISQSGTTTDTNRTVDLLRSRGASVVAIVNRRHSDLCDKADGVLFTSDGRDIEMSVASTKAFYSQIAAGFLLAFAIHRVLEPAGSTREQEILAALRELPAAMSRVLDLGSTIGAAAVRHAPQRRHWAVVGNGKNQIAAQEIRIKLSELCYKSIACDTTEDKKHIDLSAEPMILVCACGLSGSTADDVAKELSIYRAHKAAPILITTKGGRPYDGALDVLEVPEAHPSLAFVLCTMVGHLFGYHAALAIDSLAHPLRKARAAIENLVSTGPDHDDLLNQLAPRIQDSIDIFFRSVAQGRYNGQLEASTAVRLAALFRYVDGTKPLESFQQELGDVGTPSLVVEQLTEALTRAIEELTRPVDAIKHQAKTVTVGISRSDEALLTVGLVKELLATGVPRNHIAYRELRSVAALDPAVRKVVGYTRYRIRDMATADARNGATIQVLSQGGAAKGIPSRTASNPELRGTKHLVASERELLVARGRSDNRTVILVPEVDKRETVGLTLMHVEFHDHLDKDAMRSVLSGYRHRYQALRDLVTETEPSFADSKLAEIPVVELLTVPVHVLADRWR